MFYNDVAIHFRSSTTLELPFLKLTSIPLVSSAPVYVPGTIRGVSSGLTSQTVYSRFCKWRDDGTLLKIFEALNADADYENLCIDSTIIKAHPQSAGAKKGL